MATTTNYGFTVPTSADLVKNGATAISTLGQNVDTFLFRPFTRNCLLNSSFNVWQRGTSFAINNSNTYTADRWQAYRGSAGLTVTRQNTNDTTNLPFIQYAARVARDSGNTGTGDIVLAQNVESLNSTRYAGQTVTFSFYARAGANYSAASSALKVFLQTGTGTDQNWISPSGVAYPINTTATLTTTWQRFTFSATVASTATQLFPYFVHTPVGTAGAADYFEVTGVQLEVGSQASPYAPATPTYATELAACQRYYEKSYAQATAPATATFVGCYDLYIGTTVTGAGDKIQYKVTKRTTPTVTIYSPSTGASGKVFNNSNATDYTATQSSVGENVFTFYWTQASSGLNASYHYVASAEL